MQTQDLKDKSKLTRTELAVLIAAATVTITFVSTCSPLYPFNPWDDTNCFFTIGRSMIHGKVLYRDVFDHKGPFLFFIYALTALVSDTSFTGPWLLECIMASIYSVFAWKIAKLFVTPSKYAIALMPLFLGVVYTSRLFNFGGNAEEICFPLLTVALYFGLKAIVKGDGLPAKGEALICGMIAGVLFWLKFTLVGFMAGFCFYILLYSIIRKEFVKLWSLVWRFLAGVIIVTVPVFVYFLATRSLDYLWESYFLANTSFYLVNTNAKPSISEKVIKTVIIPIFALRSSSVDYPSFGVLLGLSAVSMFFIDKTHRLKTALFVALTFAFSVGFVFVRASNIYYYSYIFYYCFCLSVIPFIKGLNYLEKLTSANKKIIKTFITAVLLIFYVFSIFMCKNMYLIFKPKDYLAQYRMAETINQTPDAKILTYCVMDSGFYTAAGLLPQNRFFGPGMNLMNNYPAIQEEQDRLVEEGYFDYIVTSYFLEPEWDNYELVQVETDPFIDYTGEAILDGHKLYKRI